MVKTLSTAEKEALTQAIIASGERTCAELVAVINPASDAYQSFALLYEMIVASLVTLALWYSGTLTFFPMLMITQFGLLALFMLFKPLRRLCIGVVPLHIRHQRAARRAFEEYLRLCQHLPTETPAVLFFVSMAERYVHIIPGRSVREKIANKEWDAVVSEFTSQLPAIGLGAACVQAVKRMTDLLAQHFPLSGQTHHFAHHVIETGSD